MKLRNKRTGDIWEFDEGLSMKASQETAEKAGAISGSLTCFANSLAELNEEWEDYEEPKDHYYIDYDGDIMIVEALDYEPKIKAMKQIGNYFETEEQAERAVEKLNAWQRLKDKGFRFTGYNACSVDYDIDEQYRKYISDDLDLLFGGEE